MQSEMEQLSILVRREGDVFVAQCVEYDVCTQADDISTLRERMDALLSVELQTAEAAGDKLPRAPEAFAAIWAKSGGHAVLSNYRFENAA